VNAWGYMAEAILPPSQMTFAQWAEANVRLDHTSYIQGALSLEFYPQLRAFLAHAQRRRMKRITAITSAQSAKTTAVMLTLLARIAENPTPAMWVSASTEKAKEFAKRRLYPFILDCEKVRRLAPKDRSEWTGRLVQFASMDLMIRGAVSKADMTSDPVGLLICDERREWRPGMIELARKRIVTFGNAQELSIGTAGIKDDSLHRDYESGSRGLLLFTCPACQHRQPFRFGKKATPIFPEQRERGGVVWPDDERTRNADGSWNMEAVSASAHYECEACGHLIPETQRIALLRDVTELHRTPKRAEEFPSLHWNVSYMPMASLGFGAQAVEFLSATQALKSTGDTEPLKAFVCDSQGEPWEMLASRVEASDIMARVGNYRTGEKFHESAGTIYNVLTVDRQKGHLVYVWRQWLKGGASRLIEFGMMLDNFDELRKFQIDRGIRNVAGDDGGYDEEDTGNVYRWRMACLKYGWHSFKGDKADSFRDGQVRTYWKRSPFNTGVGQHVLTNAYLWSKSHYLGKLYNVFLKGEGPPWQVPRDAHVDYLRQLSAYEFVPGSGPGDPGEWKKKGHDHAASCELMQIAFADSASIIEKFTKEN